MKVPLSFPSLDHRDMDNVQKVIQSGQLVQGAYVKALETIVRDLIGVSHAVAVSSGTATLHLALLSLGVGPGDEVIVPAFSYVATANVVELVGARPVFVDIRPDSFNINGDLIEAAVTACVKVIMPVHEFGHPADMETIKELADTHRLLVVEDAACALGADWRGRKVGAWGDVGSFSLHPRKAVTSGEGGILTTNDEDLADYFRIMRNHGIDDSRGTVDFVAAGFNYRMTDMQAALAIGQVERLEEIIAKRAAVAGSYNKELKPRFFRKPIPPVHGRATWQSYHIVLEDGIDQSRFLLYLAGKGIGANYGAQCIPVQTYYRRKYGYDKSDFSEAFRAFSQGIVLPIFDSMSDDQISYVVENINSCRG